VELQIINLPKIIDERGNLTFLQCPGQIPFEIQRVFWTYGVPGGDTRGGHAYKSQIEIIIALSGSFDVEIKKKNKKVEIFSLNRSYYGLLVPPNTWRSIKNFSTNALSMHLSNQPYSREDYIYNWEDFVRFSHE
jgi:dTDP-4-dehydrorhamnose 3,5-epimerase-like enzyme